MLTHMIQLMILIDWNVIKELHCIEEEIGSGT